MSKLDDIEMNEYVDNPMATRKQLDDPNNGVKPSVLPDRRNSALEIAKYLHERSEEPSSKTDNPRVTSSLKRGTIDARFQTELKGEKEENSSLFDKIYDFLDGVGEDAMVQSYSRKDFLEFRERIGREQFNQYGLASVICLAAIFFYFFSVNFNNYYYNQQFVSVQSDAGNCQNVPLPYTLPSITLDSNGNWEGSSSYNPNLNMYTYSIVNFEATIDEYTEWFKAGINTIDQLGVESAERDLALNLLYWSSWRTYQNLPSSSNNQIIQFSADANSILQPANYLAGTTSSIRSDCNFSTVTSVYNPASANMEIFINVPLFLNDISCRDSLPLKSVFGYNPAYNGEIYTLALNSYALLAALTVAFNINGFTSLKFFRNIDTVVKTMYQGEMYQVSRYYDPLYPNMDPIYCIGRTDDFFNSNTTNCLIRIINQGYVSYGVPIFRHIGSGINDTAKAYNPRPCICNTEGYTPYCNTFQFLAGVLVYNSSKSEISSYLNSFSSISGTESINPYLPYFQLFYEQKKTISELNAELYNASFVSIYSSVNSKLNAQSLRNEYYSSTYTPTFGYGYLIMFHAASVYDHTISPDKFQLTNGACADNFGNPNVSNAYTTPWGNLNQAYYRCTQTAQDSFFSAIGVATGTSSALVPTFFSLVIFFVVMYRKRYPIENMMRKKNEEEYLATAPEVRATQAILELKEKSEKERVQQIEELVLYQKDDIEKLKIIALRLLAHDDV